MPGLTPKCRHCKAHRKINVQNLNKIFKFEQNLLCGNLDKDDNSALLCLTIQQSGFGAWTPHAFFEEIGLNISVPLSLSSSDCESTTIKGFGRETRENQKETGWDQFSGLLKGAVCKLYNTDSTNYIRP